MRKDSCSMKRSCAVLAQPSSTIVVRVGGVDFRTNRETLEQGGRGYFAARLQHQELMEMDFGRNEQLPFVEVDRDPDTFRYILAWMRSHQLPSAVCKDMQALEDIVPEAAFFALDALGAAVETALIPLRQYAEPLRSFSVTTGTILMSKWTVAGDYGECGEEIKTSLELAPHEYCLVTFITATTHSFNRPRKHHRLLCFVEEPDIVAAGSAQGGARTRAAAASGGGAAADIWKSVVPEVILGSAVAREGTKAAEVYQASRIVLASFVYKHIGRGDESDDEDVVTDSLCTPIYSQRVNMILGPRGVHNPVDIPAAPDSNGVATRLTFGDDKYAMNTGATWTLFGVIGPAAKVLEYARGSGA